MDKEELETLKEQWGDTDNLINDALNYIKSLQEENKELNRIVELYGKSLYNADLTHYKEENQKLVKVIDELVKFAYGTEMSLGEFKGLFKIATGKDFIPKISVEKQLTELKGDSDDVEN